MTDSSGGGVGSGGSQGGIAGSAGSSGTEGAGIIVSWAPADCAVEASAIRFSRKSSDSSVPTRRESASMLSRADMARAISQMTTPTGIPKTKTATSTHSINVFRLAHHSATASVHHRIREEKQIWCRGTWCVVRKGAIYHRKLLISNECACERWCRMAQKRFPGGEMRVVCCIGLFLGKSLRFDQA